jgi:parvulin-like peptidyl-prolyl isomerase
MAIRFSRFSLFTQFTRFAQFAQSTKFTWFSQSEELVNSENSVNLLNHVNYVNFLFLSDCTQIPPHPPFLKGGLLIGLLCSMLVVLSSCAGLSHKEEVLAVVNGEPITAGDFKYSLTISHRREDLSSAGALNLSQFVQKLIDDRLIVQEARRMGMEDYPEVRQAIQAYILRESVVRLHDDEIVKQVKVTDQEIRSFYKRNYEQFVLGIIRVDTEEKAREILQQLRGGRDFQELAREYSPDPSQKDAGEVTLRRSSLNPVVDRAISNLKPGEFTGVVGVGNKFYIIKLVTRKEAPDEGLESVKGNIERALRRQKEKERSDEYLKYLRERLGVQVNDEIFSSINLAEKSETEKLSQDERILVRINGSTLTVGDFVSLAKSYPKRSKDAILNDWTEQKLIDIEALSRHYEKQKEFREMVDRYEDQLLKNTFINKVIVPQIALSDEALKEYYLSHQESFMKPASFKIQQITVKTVQDAEDILNDLKNGAEFSWLAKNRSVDATASEGGNLGWLTKAEMPVPVRKVIETLKPGDISPIVKIDSFYRITKLLDRKEGELEEFAKVKRSVHRAAFEEQVNDILNSYISQLKKDSDIRVNDEEVKLLEEKIQK